MLLKFPFSSLFMHQTHALKKWEILWWCDSDKDCWSFAEVNCICPASASKHFQTFTVSHFCTSKIAHSKSGKYLTLMRIDDHLQKSILFGQPQLARTHQSGNWRSTKLLQNSNLHKYYVSNMISNFSLMMSVIVQLVIPALTLKYKSEPEACCRNCK